VQGEGDSLITTGRRHIIRKDTISCEGGGSQKTKRKRETAAGGKKESPQLANQIVKKREKFLPLKKRKTTVEDSTPGFPSGERERGNENITHLGV